GGVLAHKVDDLLEEGRISAPLGKPQANAAWKYVLYGDRLHQHLVARSSPAGRVNRKRATARLVPGGPPFSHRAARAETSSVRQLCTAALGASTRRGNCHKPCKKLWQKPARE